MLKKLLTGALAAGAMAVPLAAVAWADPSPAPNPPSGPDTNAQGPGNPGTPVAPSSYGQGPTCLVLPNAPAQGTSVQGAAEGGMSATNWQQVATLQGSVASNLGLPAGQTMKVFCAPAGTPNPQGLPIGYQPGQPNPGQTNPAPWQNQPGQPGPQSPAPGQ